MDTKNNLHTQSNPLIMIICEENKTLRTLFDNEENISSSTLFWLSLRSRLNPYLTYYKVDCEAQKRYGYTADELFEDIHKRYIDSGYQSLDKLFTFIQRI